MPATLPTAQPASDAFLPASGHTSFGAIRGLPTLEWTQVVNEILTLNLLNFLDSFLIDFFARYDDLMVCIEERG